MFRISSLILVLSSTVAFAQQPPVEQRALGEKLTQEITENVQLRAALIAAKDKINDLQKQLDDTQVKKEKK